LPDTHPSLPAQSTLGEGTLDDSAIRTATPSNPHWAAALFPFFYLLLALLCLWHWGSNRPWSSLDRFSGTFLALNVFLTLKQIGFKKSILRSREVLREASGTSFDPATVKWASLQSLAELTVFLDYAHWHLVLMLKKPILQEAGLAVSILSVIWLVWADAILVEHFAHGLENRELVTRGPYGLVRHPRYAGLLGLKTGFALTFASILGWLSLVVAVMLTGRRIRLEEEHLRAVFGRPYEQYEQRTARMVPWLY